MIIAADVVRARRVCVLRSLRQVYDPPTVRALVALLAKLLAAPNTRACIASTIRNPPTYAFFEQQLSEHHLDTSYVGEVPPLFEYNRSNIKICWVTKC